MGRLLTVILGAGAAHSINSLSHVLVNEEYRPPLAQDIFKASSEFRTILRRYPLAEHLTSDIERKLRQNEEGIGLEQILRGYQEEGRANGNIARQFLQTPLYLNHLFGEISTHFTQKPDEYNILVNAVLPRTTEALFLTLNYDNLLEIPLSRVSGVDFEREEDYLQNGEWKLLKLHGSVNWYRSFSSYQVSEADDNAYFSQLRHINLPLSFDSRYRFTGLRGHAQKFIDGIPVYPAITVPVDGKYERNVPESHLRALENFLTECGNYLIIGTRGLDQDLLDLLKKNTPPSKALVVGKSEMDTEATRQRFESAVDQFHSRTSVFSGEHGFSSFVDSGELERFLDSLQ